MGLKKKEKITQKFPAVTDWLAWIQSARQEAAGAQIALLDDH